MGPRPGAAQEEPRAGSPQQRQAPLPLEELAGLRGVRQAHDRLVVQEWRALRLLGPLPQARAVGVRRQERHGPRGRRPDLGVREGAALRPRSAEGPIRGRPGRPGGGQRRGAGEGAHQQEVESPRPGGGQAYRRLPGGGDRPRRSQGEARADRGARPAAEKEAFGDQREAGGEGARDPAAARTGAVLRERRGRPRKSVVRDEAASLTVGGG